jgi:NAD(P)-dependent dehydrogenase (short-subunit alcohol dehydrogenase family)
MRRGAKIDQPDDSSAVSGDVMRLANKVAIVTGGSRGIGRAIAVGLAAEGARVAIVHVTNRATAQETLDEIHAAGGSCSAIQADVSSAEGVRHIVDEMRAGHGRIDVLVNVAGRLHVAGFLETSEAEWDDQFDVNAKAVFFLSQAVAREMIGSGGGRIVNVTSIAGDRADPAFVAYCASKGAANILTKAMAAALGPHGITVNAVLPGTTVTDMNRARLEDRELRESIEQLTPLGRLGRPSDIVGAVAYLASDEAGWTTGAMVTIDGGMTA